MVGILSLAEESLYPIVLNANPDERAVAEHMAALSINWGRLEYWLYQILVSVDSDRAVNWTADFFIVYTWKKKKDKVRKEVLVEITDTDFRNGLDATFMELDNLCLKRNKLNHGIWRRLSPGVFEITPLRLEQTGEFEAPLIVSPKDLQDLLRAMDGVEQNFALLGAEAAVHQHLKKEEEMRRRKGKDICS